MKHIDDAATLVGLEASLRELSRSHGVVELRVKISFSDDVVVFNALASLPSGRRASSSDLSLGRSINNALEGLALWTEIIVDEKRDIK